MALAPRLIDVATPARPAGVVLVLHGGARQRGDATVSPTQPSVLRMVPLARRVARVGRGELAVFRLLNSARGWDTRHTPVQDATWALDEIARRLGDRLPACLVGHSLGGRAALFAAGAPEVRGAVALAPWLYPSDAPRGLAGRRVLLVHGTRDRIADPGRARLLARRLQAEVDVTYVSVDGGRHAMLRHHRRFDALAAAFASDTLLGTLALQALRT